MRVATEERAEAARPGGPVSPLAVGSVDCWLFDLDNTLYPRACGLSAQIHARQVLYIRSRLGVDPGTAAQMRRRYALEHGTALVGLMRRHGVDPSDYLAFVHEVDYGVLAADPALDAALARLPGRRLVFTNASQAHALRVLQRLGIDGRFEAVFDLAAAGYAAKPDPAAYDRLVARHAVRPQRALFCEDTLRNLAPARALGMRAVWLAGPAAPAEPVLADVHRIDDLTTWMTGLARSEAGREGAPC